MRYRTAGNFRMVQKFCVFRGLLIDRCGYGLHIGKGVKTETTKISSIAVASNSANFVPVKISRYTVYVSIL